MGTLKPTGAMNTEGRCPWPPAASWFSMKGRSIFLKPSGAEFEGAMKASFFSLPSLNNLASCFGDLTWPETSEPRTTEKFLGLVLLGIGSPEVRGSKLRGTKPERWLCSVDPGLAANAGPAPPPISMSGGPSCKRSHVGSI